MHAVTVSVNATDSGAGGAVCSIDSVSSNEGGNQHEPDVELTGALTLNLRAERDGNAGGAHLHPSRLVQGRGGQQVEERCDRERRARPAQEVREDGTVPRRQPRGRTRTLLKIVHV